MKHIIVSIALLSLVGCAAAPKKPATRQERSQRADELFMMYDANGDGFLTRAELKGAFKSAMNYQPNSNLMLGLDGQPKKQSKRKQMKQMSDQEVERTIQEAFATRDADLDNRLSKEEFKKLVVERPATAEDEDPWASL